MPLTSKCRWAVLALVLLSGCHPAPVQPPAPPVSPDPVIFAGLLTRHNAERAKYNLAPLAADNTLTEFAQKHAEWMAVNGMHHSGGPYAENIARGQASVVEVMHDWIASPGHEANICGDSTKVGFGWAADADVLYWSAEFAP